MEITTLEDVMKFLTTKQCDTSRKEDGSCGHAGCLKALMSIQVIQEVIERIERLEAKRSGINELS